MFARIHDLLEVDAQGFLHANSSVPAWVAQSLTAVPFVVVRRGTAVAGEIAVGVRGAARNQRWAASCPESLVRRMVSPAELVSGLASALPGAPPATSAPTQSRLDSIPALRSLAALSQHQSWKSLQHRWGPGGSIGFELATARHTATPQSDLDIVIYADERLSAEEAKRLHASTQNLPSAVDVRVETPFYGFSLTEYASRTPASILLRTVSGTMLGTDPWEACPNSGLAAARLAPASPP